MTDSNGEKPEGGSPPDGDDPDSANDQRTDADAVVDTDDTAGAARDPAAKRSFASRRRVLELLTLAGLGTYAASEPAAAVEEHDHLGEAWKGDPGTRGLVVNAGSNTQFGLMGLTSAPDGRGVVGRVTASESSAIGVLGRAESSDGVGIQGQNNATSGPAFGGLFRTFSTDGRGLLGIAEASRGNTFGAIGKSRSPGGVGVEGNVTATTGRTVGVRGVVDSPDGYGLVTPDDARVDGTMATVDGWRVLVDDSRALLLGGESSGDAGNVVHGHSSNDTAQGVVGATVGGGGFEDDEDAWPNEVFDNYGTVAGGRRNRAGADNGDPTIDAFATVGGGEDNVASAGAATVGGGFGNAASARFATVSGGDSNTASAYFATVGGGEDNVASGLRATVGGGGGFFSGGNEASGRFATVSGGADNTANTDGATVGGGEANVASGANATVPGGQGNTAGGFASLAAGQYADAADDHSFVWNDGSGPDGDSGGSTDPFSSSTDDGFSGVSGERTFNAKATKGVRFITSGSNGLVTFIRDGTAGWASTSTRDVKTDVDPVDPRAVLSGVERMEISTWEYEDADGGGAGVRHMGPMAEEFHEQFDLGGSDREINAINADGVALAAIQGLAARLGAKDDRIEELEAESDRKDDRIGELESRNEALEARLDALEERVDGMEVGDTPPSPSDG